MPAASMSCERVSGQIIGSAQRPIRLQLHPSGETTAPPSSVLNSAGCDRIAWQFRTASGPHLQGYRNPTINQRLVALFRTRQLLANAVGGRGCSPDDPLVVPSTGSRRPPDPAAGFCFGRGIHRDPKAGMTAASHTRSRHEQPDRRAGASQSLPSKDTDRGASPPLALMASPSSVFGRLSKMCHARASSLASSCSGGGV